MKQHYSVVVVGSGYGGAIAASRLARAGQQVAILERGREFQSGEFPDTEPEALAEVQAQLPSRHIGSRAGLYDFYVNADVNVFVGCGLGGTSLINANVAIQPEPRVFEDARWPQALREDPGALADGYQRAQEMLQPAEYPKQYPPLLKLEALEASAAQLGQKCARASITVNFKEGVNHVGVAQRACMLCGDCISGCNYAAKNTVMFNYLPDACNFGAEIYTQVAVRSLEARDGRWLVHFQALDTGLEGYDAPTKTVSADIVVLAAGTLGSTEILLRSKAAGLALSDQVGEHFSGNGDVVGYSYACDREIDGVGYGHRDPRDMEAVGPAVTGLIDMRAQHELNDGIVIQELATPGALSGLLPAALATTASALGKHTSEGLEAALEMEESEVESLFLGPYEAAARNTQAYLVTTHEGGSGRMSLADDRLQITWPHVGAQPIFEKVNETLAEATRALGGTYMANPMWSKLFNRDLITFHPLGGCVMADDAATGVVNHKGQVFSSAGGTAVHDGLYVWDGAIIPRSLGASPLLTIAALAERACALAARDRGWSIDYALPSRPAEAPWPTPPGVQFTATLRGDFPADRSSFELNLTVVSDDLNAMLRDPGHRARVHAKAVAPSFSAHPLTCADGDCRMMAPAAEPADARQIVYRMTLLTREGRSYYLHGWQQGATLHVVLHDGGAETSNIIGKAILRMLPQDLRTHLATLRVVNAASAKERLAATARVGRALAGDLYDIYGGVVGGTLPRKKRPLRVNAPNVYHLALSDAVDLRLTRYQGGSRGPAILAPGSGVSSTVFSLDTVETNLLEFLYAHGYDVWLLDGPDDLAAKDYQAAVDKVREVAAVPNLQLVSRGLAAAVTAKLEGVRAAIATPAPLDDDGQLNTATREVLHEIIGPATPDYVRLGSLIGRNAARDVYPLILEQLEASGLFAGRVKV